ncbi:MAG TPA: class I SAM-dependent methyltransferase [Deltaproteobacteria bacterium]|jgi:demethylmenaquinone methyltransferase/2-methoxy-6-polyprenyl-1,4-benzoquinol methylase|nr:class I SAM-dependent methyltransferase [Deltaproteobacteria bacterium]HQI00899.1 class I SAM-dependent methyltransferase [Deltaproteobacteria bacterium]HQJ09270.1 class I SAM-dependent methyltransferase [Deltaproteobacteria bacterium]
MKEGQSMKDGYWLVGFQYELSGALYSLGRIPRCKSAMLKHLKPGDKVLVAGVGHGTEAIEASRLGADVTAIDLSETMLKHFRKRIARENPRSGIRVIHDDVFNFKETGQYDMVIANFFLNVFSETRVKEVANHLGTLVKPDGYFVVGEFVLPEKGWRGLIQSINWYIAISIYSSTTEAVFHPVWNYPGLVEGAGCTIQDIEYFTIGGVRLYWSILGKKTGGRISNS